MNFSSIGAQIAYAAVLVASLCNCDAPEPPIRDRSDAVGPRVETIRPTMDSRFYEQIILNPANSTFLDRAGLRTGEFLLNIHLVAEEAFVFSTEGRSITLYSGCRVHECDSKAYLATDLEGRIVAAAIQTATFCSRDTMGPCSSGRPFVYVATRDVDPQLLGPLIERIKARCRSGSTVGGECNIYILQPS